MKIKLATAVFAASLAVTGCATNRYGDPYNNNDGRSSSATRAATGAAVGAAVGAGLGAVVPGVSAVQGAVAGGVAGAVLGAVVNGRQYYRNTRGACFYYDQYGQPVYDPQARC